MSINVQGTAGAAQWVGWADASSAKRPADETDRTAAITAAPTKTAAPTRPATTGLTQQDFEVAMRYGAGGTMSKTLDQIPGVKKLDRHGFDPVADRKAVTEFDRVTTSLRNAALRYHGPAVTPLEGSAESATDATSVSTPAATSWAYKPLTSNEFGTKYVLDALAAYKSNSALTATTQPAASVVTTTAPATQPAAPSVTTPATSTPTSAATTTPAATTPAPAATTPPATGTTSPAPATTTPPAATSPATPAPTTPATAPTTPAATTPPATSTPKPNTPAQPDLLGQLGTLLNTLLGVKK